MEDEGWSTQRVIGLRRVTRAIADLLHGQLKLYLSALSPLFRPAGVLGDYVQGGSKESSAMAAKAFQEVQAVYISAAGAKPFDLPSEIKPPLNIVQSALDLIPMEYAYTPKADGEAVWMVSHRFERIFFRCLSGRLFTSFIQSGSSVIFRRGLGQATPEATTSLENPSMAAFGGRPLAPPVPILTGPATDLRQGYVIQPADSCGRVAQAIVIQDLPSPSEFGDKANLGSLSKWWPNANIISMYKHTSRSATIP